MNIIEKIFGNRQANRKEKTIMTNTQKALELINTFTNGDTEKQQVCLRKATSSTTSPMAQDVTPLSARLLISHPFL